MRQLLVILALALCGCPGPSSYPLQICSKFEDECTAGFECVGFHCIEDCRYEGDCDLGFRCLQGQCLQSCDATQDCAVGVCELVGDGRPGSACQLRNLPDCATDDHCGWGICIDGGCLTRCDWDGACGLGMMCDYRRGDYGTCVTDPDYAGPPAPTNCAEAPFPDQWCQSTTSAFNAYCETGTCYRGYVAVAVLDETPNELCPPDEASPGTDVIGVRFGSGGGTYISTWTVGVGEGNEHGDPAVLQTVDVPVCEPNGWMSLGCGGGLVFVSDTASIRGGTSVEVYTRDNYCLDPSGELASLYLCDEFPWDMETTRLWCTTYLGPATSPFASVPLTPSETLNP